MKNRLALSGFCFVALACLTASNLAGFAFNNAVNAWNTVKAKDTGMAFITQSAKTGSMQATQNTGNPSEAVWGMTWDSVRTFQLSQRLSSPLKVYIETQPRQSSLYKAQYKAYILKSLDEWSAALNHRLQYQLVPEKQAADITIQWRAGFEDRYVAGVTSYQPGHADIEIKTVGVPEKDIETNIMHEFGHALGIANHSKNGSDIMVAARRWKRGQSSYTPKLSSRDIQAIRRLYSLAWHRGEDLYSSVAQSKPATVIASQEASTEQ